MAELRPFKTYTGVQKTRLPRKVGVAHGYRDYINAKFQVSVQIKLITSIVQQSGFM